MPIQLPPSVNYQNPVNSVPALFASTPPELPRLVPIEIDWGTMGGPNNCVSINLYGGAAATISQIVAISIDNSACAADVQFIFPDTSQSYTVSRYQPIAVFPVFTNATSFFIYAPNAGSTDVTRFCILNTLPPPVSLPLSVEQEAAVFDAIPIATGTTVLVPAGINGVVENIFINPVFGSTSSDVAFFIQDGTGAKIAGGFATNSDTSPFSIGPINVRFMNGLNLVQTLTGTTGNSMAVNLYYRTP